MGRAGRDHSLLQPPCSSRVAPEHTAQDGIQTALEHRPRGRLHNLHGQSVQVCGHPQSSSSYSGGCRTFPVVLYVDSPVGKTPQSSSSRTRWGPSPRPTVPRRVENLWAFHIPPQELRAAGECSPAVPLHFLGCGLRYNSPS